jgi:hypothetical protein
MNSQNIISNKFDLNWSTSFSYIIFLKYIEHLELYANILYHPGYLYVHIAISMCILLSISMIFNNIIKIYRGLQVPNALAYYTQGKI